LVISKTFGNNRYYFWFYIYMTIFFKNTGTNLGTRFLGQQFRMDIELALSKNEFVVFDFGGVDFISHSFADECFGKLLLENKLSDLKKQTTFQNANELIKKTIAFTLKERLIEEEAF